MTLVWAILNVMRVSEQGLHLTGGLSLGSTLINITNIFTHSSALCIYQGQYVVYELAILFTDTNT